MREQYLLVIWRGDLWANLITLTVALQESVAKQWEVLPVIIQKWLIAILLDFISTPKPFLQSVLCLRLLTLLKEIMSCSCTLGHLMNYLTHILFSSQPAMTSVIALSTLLKVWLLFTAQLTAKITYLSLTLKRITFYKVLSCVWNCFMGNYTFYNRFYWNLFLWDRRRWWLF